MVVDRNAIRRRRAWTAEYAVFMP